MSTPLRRAHNITLAGAALNAALGAVKIVVGAIAHSQALVADGVHSLTDLLSDGLTLLATHLGRQEADANHPYGHERIETLSTFLLGTLIILVAAGLAWDALSSLAAPALAPRLWLALPVALLTVLAKEWLYQATARAARQLDSELIYANAWHHRSDAISSIIVIAGLLGAALGWIALDAVAAAMMCVLIAAVGGQLVWRSVRELIDTAPPRPYMRHLHQLAEDVPGVDGVHKLRARRMAGRTLVDLDIEVPADASVSEGHRLGLEFTRRVHQRLPDVTEVHYHIDPANYQGPTAERSAHVPLRPEVLYEAFAEGLPVTARSILHYNDYGVSIDVLLPGETPIPRLAAEPPPWLGQVRFWRPVE